jgi:hypothetical protein
VSSYELGRYFCDNPHHALLHHVLDQIEAYRHLNANLEAHPGVALEFGVGGGDSARCIARHLGVYGFDSFQGLPEDWRPGFEQGMFAADYTTVRDSMPDNVWLVPGLFEESLAHFKWDGMRDIRLVHIDCDLYSSTKTVLENLPWDRMLRPYGGQKPIIVFDEWWGYPEAEQHEQRAWREFTSKEPWDHLEWEVVGHGVQQWGIQLV